MVKNFILTALVGLCGGIIFYLLHIPIPWLLGSMTFIIAYKQLFKQKTHWPNQMRNSGLMVTGYSLGLAFSLETCLQVAIQLPAILIVTLSLVAFGLVLGYITYKKAKVSLASAILGTTPGGLTLMTTLSEEIADADVTVVTFMQTVRQLSIVFIVPLVAMSQLPALNDNSFSIEGLFGLGSPLELYTPLNIAIFVVAVVAAGLLARRFKVPNGVLLGPLAITAVLVIAGIPDLELPKIVLYLAQLFIGIHLGNKIKMASLTNWKLILPFAFGGCVLMVAFSLGVGYLLTMVFPYLTLVDGFLCTAPGSMPEMGFITMQIGANITAFTAFQIFRVFFINFILPFLIKWRFGGVKETPA